MNAKLGGSTTDAMSVAEKANPHGRSTRCQGVDVRDDAFASRQML
jgi:hypothetical protein